MNAGAPVFVPKATAVHSGNRLHRMTSSSGGREKKDGGSSGRSNNEGKALALQLFSFEGDEDRAEADPHDLRYPGAHREERRPRPPLQQGVGKGE